MYPSRPIPDVALVGRGCEEPLWASTVYGVVGRRGAPDGIGRSMDEEVVVSGGGIGGGTALLTGFLATGGGPGDGDLEPLD